MKYQNGHRQEYTPYKPSDADVAIAETLSEEQIKLISQLTKQDAQRLAKNDWNLFSQLRDAMVALVRVHQMPLTLKQLQFIWHQRRNLS